MKKQKDNFRALKYTWVMGFCSLSGLTYFINGQPGLLYWFAFLSFFGFRYTYKIQKGRQDEMMLYHNSRAAANAGIAAISALVAIGTLSLISSSWNFTLNEVFYILATVIGVNAYVLTYIISFLVFEKRE
ncbi:MAG: DUF3796 domain-containing protein [Rikenellaceae bacterium]|nr:DUF3796 domain-containing protein [Rikenellaceae bacterium]